MAAKPKTWAKVNVTPETAKIIKRIALDENLYTYQLIDEVFKEKYAKYFQKYGTKNTTNNVSKSSTFD